FKYENTNWNVVGNGAVSDATCLQFDLEISPDGIIYVAYTSYPFEHKLSVKKFDGINWVYVGDSIISNDYAEDVDLGIDGNGIPYVVYTDHDENHKLTVKRFFNGTWVAIGNEGFTSGTANYGSINFNPSNQPIVAFRDGSAGGKASVMHFNGTSWEYIGYQGFSHGPSTFHRLRFGGSGIPYLYFQDYGTGGGYKVYRYINSVWSTVGNLNIQGAGFDYYDLAVDQFDHCYFVAQNHPSNKMYVLKFDGYNWDYLGDTAFSNGNFWYPKIVIDTVGASAYVIYKDLTDTLQNTKVKTLIGAVTITENEQISTIKCYPNPTSGKIHFSNLPNDFKGYYSIYDIFGS